MVTAEKLDDNRSGNMAFYEDRVIDFFGEYVTFDRSGLDRFGRPTCDAITDAVNLLLKENIFTSKSALRRQALKDYSIILPEWMFEGGSENGKK